MTSFADERGMDERSDWMRLRQTLSTLSDLWGVHVALREEGDIDDVRQDLVARWNGQAFVFSIWDQLPRCFDQHGTFTGRGAYRIMWGPASTGHAQTFPIRHLRHELKRQGFTIAQGEECFDITAVAPEQLSPEQLAQQQLDQFQAKAVALGVSPAALALERFTPGQAAALEGCS